MTDISPALMKAAKQTWQGEGKMQRPDDPLATFLEVWGDGYLAGDIGSNLTCIEAEAIASLFLSLGQANAAEAWIDGHSEGDDCGDMHCRCDDADCIAERGQA
ncbi:hypothetical protein KIV66_gp74 [Mycobacterium phage MyraDee]|uniref:Uncharacterized protein n=1 Tax=Mycobacterium phage MyraDee TaxID=2024303 RepID=A0A222YY20_9CAUD|nr:hypothetical protein KIV66_gp74 [Mycobacterium phage MyraDee]ASR77181.1 hypothetical protein SEA_MYRADEE_74 [Mycobacterium phage MyraDee]